MLPSWGPMGGRRRHPRTLWPGAVCVVRATTTGADSTASGLWRPETVLRPGSLRGPIVDPRRIRGKKVGARLGRRTGGPATQRTTAGSCVPSTTGPAAAAPQAAPGRRTDTDRAAPGSEVPGAVCRFAAHLGGDVRRTGAAARERSIPPPAAAACREAGALRSSVGNGAARFFTFTPGSAYAEPPQRAMPPAERRA